MILELPEKVKNIICDNSSSFRSENVKTDANSKIERLKPHSNHFLTLCFVNVMEIDNIRKMKNYEDERQSPYIWI